MLGFCLPYMQQRYYDPQVGRFLSVDPVQAITADGSNFNRYWYANNNPYKFTDPDGRWSIRSPQSFVRAMNEQVRDLGQRAESTARDLAPRIGNTLLGVAEGLAGAGLVIASAPLAVNEDTALLGFGGIALGSMHVRDGYSAIANAWDNGDRRTVLGEAGEAVGGEVGGDVGDLVAVGLSGKGAINGIEAVVEGGGKKAAAAAALDTTSTVKGVNDLADD